MSSNVFHRCSVVCQKCSCHVFNLVTCSIVCSQLVNSFVAVTCAITWSVQVLQLLVVLQTKQTYRALACRAAAEVNLGLGYGAGRGGFGWGLERVT